MSNAVAPEDRIARTRDGKDVAVGDFVYELTTSWTKVLNNDASLGDVYETRIVRRRVIAISPSGSIATREKGIGSYRSAEGRYARYIPAYDEGRYFSTAEACREYYVAEARHSADIAMEQAKRAAERREQYENAKVYHRDEVPA